MEPTLSHLSGPIRQTGPAGERAWIAPGARPLLAAVELDSLAALLEFGSSDLIERTCAQGSLVGRRLRTFAGRANWRLTIEMPAGGATLYLKKHRARGWWHKLRAWCGRSRDSAGWLEGEHIRRLQTAGVPTADLLACGERLHAGRLESYVLTAELAGFVQLDHFLRQPPTGARLYQLVREAAELVRRFHGAGFNHRDLYACHVFVRERQGDEAAAVGSQFDLRLIDLERAQLRSHGRYRWLVKDLAQLAYSTPPSVRCTHRVAFLKAYLGVTRLGPRHKQLLRDILRKMRWMEWKLGAYGVNPRGVPVRHAAAQESQR